MGASPATGDTRRLVPMSTQVAREALKGFPEAFDDHDLDAIMGFFADDCVFYLPRGAKPRGDRFAGREKIVA